MGRTGLKVHAVSDVSLDILPGETLGLVGESGCGKSTTGRALIQFPPPKQGRVAFDGAELTELEGEDLRQMRTRMQMIFQDPISSLNPRRRVGDIIAEPLAIWAKPKNEKRAFTTTVAAIITTVMGVLVGLWGLGLLVLAPIAVVLSLSVPLFALSTGPIAIVAFLLGGLAVALGLWLLHLGRGMWRRDDDAWNGAMITLSYLSGLIFFVGGLIGGVGGFLIVLPVVVAFVLPLVLLSLPSSRADFPRWVRSRSRSSTTCSRPSGSIPRSPRAGVAMSSPAGSASASRWPGRWCSIRSCWCATSPSRRSTCRSRPRCSTCSRN